MSDRQQHMGIDNEFANPPVYHRETFADPNMGIGGPLGMAKKNMPFFGGQNE